MTRGNPEDDEEDEVDSDTDDIDHGGEKKLKSILMNQQYRPCRHLRTTDEIKSILLVLTQSEMSENCIKTVSDVVWKRFL